MKRSVYIIICLILPLSALAEVSKPIATPTPSNLINSEGYPEALTKAIESINNGSYEQALKELKKITAPKKIIRRQKKGHSVKIVPPEQQAYLKGVALRKMGRAKEAVKALQSSLALRGSNADAIAELGYAFLATGDSEKAFQKFKEALWFGNLRDHSTAELLYQIGVFYQNKGNLVAAKTNYNQALNNDPAYSLASLKLAEIYFADGAKKQAITLLKTAQNRDPQNEALRGALAKTLLVNVDPLIDDDDVKLALEVISPLIQNKFGKDRYLNQFFPTYIKALLLNDKLDFADKEVSEALAINKKDPNLQRLAQQIKLEKAAKGF